MNLVFFIKIKRKPKYFLNSKFVIIGISNDVYHVYKELINYIHVHNIIFMYYII